MLAPLSRALLLARSPAASSMHWDNIGLLVHFNQPNEAEPNDDATKQPNDTLDAAEHALAALAPPDGDFWHLHVDGASNYKGSEADLAVKKLVIHSDSQQITNKTTREYTEKHSKMEQYLEKVRKQLEVFQAYTFTQVRRADNAHTDALAGLDSALNHQLKRSILVEYLDKLSIETEPAAEVSQDGSGARESSGEPLVTSYNKLFLGKVDYIWRSEGLQTVRVFAPIPKQATQWTSGFPTKKWGSDHIALASELAFINNSVQS
ncbi:carbon catabolite repressor protein 4 6-like [Pyrus ussuriensis x Pyrus communis]|uniref:Carbon catabolite repressor protein 4 6-like n=1 Tax=Pyrus ussuriensis x Pyrus communis TaxID=2448454 RepID=A0A5N5HRA5_9ROSA|nr:carbon catabolite repressor protein 4 6-like [Pyrus ussuriensis x Pyrus communis]